MLRVPPLELVLLDDDPTAGDRLRRDLAAAGVECAVQPVHDAAALTQLLDRTTAPVVVVTNPKFDPVAVLQAVQRARPATPVIVASHAPDVRAAVRCVQAGAFDYVPRDPPAALAEAIGAAQRLRAPLLKLSPRQQEVLRLLAEGESTRQIATQLRLSVKTVQTHRAHVSAKLGVRSLAGLVRYAVSVNLVAPRS